MSEVDLFDFLQITFFQIQLIYYMEHQECVKNKILIVVEKVMPFQSWDNLLGSSMKYEKGLLLIYESGHKSVLNLLYTC